MQVNKVIKSFGGEVYKLSHESKCVKTRMDLNVFIPPQSEKAPVLFYLAGLTCTGDTGLEKGGFLGAAAQHNIAMVFPDTSPRTSEELVSQSGSTREYEDYDFGSGAGFYLDATVEPWNKNYRMESYIVDELPQLLAIQFPQLDFSRQSSMGHSMGGHGALTSFLRNLQRYASASAFAPVAHPILAPWGQKAFKEYLGSVEQGKEHDAALLSRSALDQGSVGFTGNAGSGIALSSILVDQGLADQFLKDQLHVESLEIGENQPGGMCVRKHPGYDHSYFFISTFAEDHIKHHAAHSRPPAPPYSE